MIDLLFIHPKVHDIKSFMDYTELSGKVCSDELRWNESNPSILFASEWIFYKKSYFELFKNKYLGARLKIAWLGEAIAGDPNIFDYIISFEDRKCDDRYIRLLSPLDMFHRFIPQFDNIAIDRTEALHLWEQKKAFCNFLYSNPHAHPMRDKLFHSICEYKHVHSIGQHLNNIGTKGTGYPGHAGECIDIKSPYRFSIASENACFHGYTSEKIFTSLLAHTVPIYWGNPDIEEDVNHECFINANNFDTMEHLVSRVKEVNENPDIWADMVSSPWMTESQLNAHRDRTSEYFEKMRYLLSGNAAKMVPEGYHIDLYRDHFFGAFPFDAPMVSRIKAKFISLLHQI